MGVLRAGVQYDDWRGTSAADNAHPDDLAKYLTSKGLIKPGEFLVGFELGVGENHGGPSKDPSITAFVASGNGFETVKDSFNATPDPLDLRKIEFDMSFADFFGLFKRFNIVLTRKGLDLADREYID